MREYSLTRRVGFEQASLRMESRHRKHAQALFNLAIDIGGALIKLCQFFSTRRDIFPKPYIEILSKLQDSVPPVSFDLIREVLASEYEDRTFPFDAIDPVPLASASIGQVHKARLAKGEEVIIKVMKPGTEDAFDEDFAILFFVFRLISYFRIFQGRDDLFTVLEEFIRVTGDELNFKREVSIAKQFRKKLVRFSYVSVPLMYDGLCTRRVIVMEPLWGDKISETEKWMKRNNDPVLIATRLTELYIEQFLSLKIVHFDPHPGNILVRDNSAIALIDFGMAGEITENMSYGMREVLLGFFKRDARQILGQLKELGFIRKNVDAERFLGLIEYVMEYTNYSIAFNKSALESVDIKPVIKELADIVYSMPFSLPCEWAFIIKTIGILGGVISSLNPKYNFYKELKPFMGRVASLGLNWSPERIFNTVKRFFQDTAAMPQRINSFVDRIQRREVDLSYTIEEIDSRIDGLKQAVSRGILFMLAFFSGACAYLLHMVGRFNGTLVMAGLGVVFLITFLVYRKRPRKDILSRYMK